MMQIGSAEFSVGCSPSVIVSNCHPVETCCLNVTYGTLISYKYNVRVSDLPSVPSRRLRENGTINER